MRYSVAFEGIDLCDEHDALLTRFDMDPPEPKVIRVDIPGGSDLDITESVGFVAYHNGKHTFGFVLRGDDLPEQLRLFSALVHGTMADYTLSWDEGYTYHGRWAIDSVERLARNAILVTCVVDRYPWKTSEGRTSLDVNSHPSGSVLMEGSTYYDDIKLETKQGASIVVGVTPMGEWSTAGTHDVAETVYGRNNVTVTVVDWWQYLDGTDLVVNTDKGYSLSGTNATFGSEWVQNGTDLYCANEAKQHSTLSFGRRDL